MCKSWSTQEIKQFVKDILGCGCPDHVFEIIAVSKMQKGALAFETTRIDVGKTLLIYMVRPGFPGGMEKAIKEITSSGREDRNTHGFNRFRLVVAGDEKELNQNRIVEAFSAATGGDEKMHLHFVKTELVSGL